MPVILAENDWPKWLGEESASEQELLALLKPCPDTALNIWPVDGMAIAEGFRHLGYKDDHALNADEWIVYDALFAYCQEMVRQGKSDGMFATR